MDENDSYIFNKFETQDQVYKYIKRPKDEWDEEKGQYDFEQCHFNCDINFNHILREFTHFAHFKHAMFNENVSFEGITFKDTADFNGCTFCKNTSFTNVTFEGDVNMNSFEGDVSFYQAKFNSDTFFWCHFKGLSNFAQCRFKNITDFSECAFEKDVRFNDTTFEKKVFFNESEFKGKVNAWNMTFLDDVTFKWSNFRKKANFSELKAKNGLVEFHGSNFESNAYFYDSKINELDLKTSVVDNGLFFLGAKINTLNRETARIIKNEFVKQNNKIEALKYHAKEMEAYKAELTKNRETARIIKSKSFAKETEAHKAEKTKNRRTGKIIPTDEFVKQKKKIEDLKDHAKKMEAYSFWDYWILKLNKYSNNYGLNPGTGIKFTLLVSLVCFFVYYLSLKEYPITFSLDSTIPETFSSLGTVASHFIEFINPIHKASFLIDYIGSWSIFIDYFSRIIIGFGIYQLIQSFRKYGRV